MFGVVSKAWIQLTNKPTDPEIMLVNSPAFQINLSNYIGQLKQHIDQLTQILWTIHPHFQKTQHVDFKHNGIKILSICSYMHLSISFISFTSAVYLKWPFLKSHLRGSSRECISVNVFIWSDVTFSMIFKMNETGL